MTKLLLIVCATLICLILLVAWALVIAARSGAGEAIEEIEQSESEPECVGTICAWCHPGVDHPGGHGICPAHRDEMLAQLKEPSKCPATTAK